MSPVKRLPGCNTCARLRGLLPQPLATRLDSIEQSRLRKKAAKRMAKQLHAARTAKRGEP